MGNKCSPPSEKATVIVIEKKRSCVLLKKLYNSWLIIQIKSGKILDFEGPEVLFSDVLRPKPGEIWTQMYTFRFLCKHLQFLQNMYFSK